MDLLPLGIPGLDDVLGGGVSPRRSYLVEGDPGAGKTTLAMQFLREGERRGERGMYIGLSESREELTDIVESHGWECTWEIFEVGTPEELTSPDSQYTIFQPAEVELGATTKAMIDAIDRVRPQRLVIDSLSEMRLIAQSSFRLRRQILALKQFLVGRDCTTLLIDDRRPGVGESQVHTIVHGVISLEHLSPEFGAERRRLQITKLRGQGFSGGYHDFRISRGGLTVFPRLVAADRRKPPRTGQLKSGLESLDALLGGGLDFGTSTLLIGPTGCGKSSVAAQYMLAAVRGGCDVASFSFDESSETFIRRCEGLGLPVTSAMQDGLLTVTQVDPAQLSPGEFAARIAARVEEGAQVVVIDSLNGYLNSMPEERFLTAQLHEILTFLNQRGVVTMLVLAQSGIVGPQMQSPVDASYLADTVVLFRYFEVMSEVRKALSVLKRRVGPHEESIRELRMSEKGLRVGDSLAGFHGILTGVPEFVGNRGQ